MARVFIPALLRPHAAGREWIDAEGATVREVVAALEAAYPEMRGRLVRDGRIVPGFAIALDGELAAFGLSEEVSAGTEVHFVPAIQGG
jgi:molybdopterin converting factor small subunit